MEIHEALTRAAEAAGWRPTRIADIAGVSQQTATTWLRGTARPRGDKLMTLRRELPGFADLLDGKAVA